MSTASAAQRVVDTQPYLPSRSADQTASARIADLRQEASQRLAAHRALRRRPAHPAATPDLFERPTATLQPQSDTRAMRIAAAVAERYAHSQSYRAFLAAEAERAIEQAQAAAVAARNAQAVATAQQQLLSDLENWSPEDAFSLHSPLEETPRIIAAPLQVAELSVRLFEERDTIHRLPINGVPNAVPYEMLGDEERDALDEEIAFRQSPVFEERAEPATPLTANLIEFPRQLVASRKARPRLAEGPLREEADEDSTGTQLRIFEVEADLISTVAETEASLPEWSSIRLGACAFTEPEAAPQYAVSSPPTVLPAPFALRLMAAAVDGSIVLSSFLGFIVIAAYAGGTVPTGQTAAISSAIVLGVTFLVYQAIFFTFAEATPGMRYARIGLCTLGDDNPSRSAMRRRIIAVLLAACPLGIGLLWAAFDDEGLGWHDRISGMYPRSY